MKDFQFEIHKLKKKKTFFGSADNYFKLLLTKILEAVNVNSLFN